MFFFSSLLILVLVSINLIDCQLNQQLFGGSKQSRDEYKLTNDGLKPINPGKHDYGRSYALPKSTSTYSSLMDQVFAGIYRLQ